MFSTTTRILQRRTLAVTRARGGTRGFTGGATKLKPLAGCAIQVREEAEIGISGSPPLPSPVSPGLVSGVLPSGLRERESGSGSSRLERIKNAKPFSEFLTDGFGRRHTYLRISVTERCNLRCVYCMPAEGVPLSPPAHLLSTPEILEIARLFVSQGVTKIRLTGGEPTVRKDIVELVEELGKLRSLGLKELAITSNGIALHRKLPRMVEAGLTGLNLSLDTLDPFQFQIMTRRKGLETVLKTIDTALDMGFGEEGSGKMLKINCVVMKGVNDREIVDFVEMTRNKPIEVRFIEYMPFDGNKWSKNKMVSYNDMVNRIKETYPTLQKLASQRPNDTSKTWSVPGFRGKVGFITSMTHNFCGSCNRLRITGDGNLKVCLFGEAEVSLRDMMRKYRNRDLEVGGVEEALGGREEMESELLNVIGKAVGNKKEKHAGMGELENMKNRPMILIDKTNNEKKSTTNKSFSLSSSSSGVLKAHIPGGVKLIQPFLPPSQFLTHTQQLRFYSNKSKPLNPQPPNPNSPPTSSPLPSPSPIPPTPPSTLTHITPTGEAHMITITSKPPTTRTATARGRVMFSNPTARNLILQGLNKKGDVLGVARIAGIMAVKRTAEVIPLCHPILIDGVDVKVELGGEVEGGEGGNGWVEICVEVKCEGKTGVEMEALTGVSVAALTVFDMCKAVDKRMVIEGVRVVRKKGGRSGDFGE